MGVTLAVMLAAAPAFAADDGTEPKFVDKAAEECYHKLAEGKKVDDCQKAPSPLLPEKNEIIWGSLAFLVLLVAMTGFEVLVSFLQAFIFTILTAVYIGGAMHPEH